MRSLFALTMTVWFVLLIGCAAAPLPPLEIKENLGRFQRTSCGTIYDSATRLEWLPGPDKLYSYRDSEYWLNAEKSCGGQWRMPTAGEMKTVLMPLETMSGTDAKKIDPDFQNLIGGQRTLYWTRDFATIMAEESFPVGISVGGPNIGMRAQTPMANGEYRRILGVRTRE